MTYLKSAIIATVVFLLLDGLWLGYFARNLYSEGIGHLMKPVSDGMGTYVPAMFVYATLVMGVLVFVLPKAAGSATAALGYGALFGFICYGVYDFTNLAIINSWPIWISVIDIAWGCVVCGVTSAATVIIGKMLS